VEAHNVSQCRATEPRSIAEVRDREGYTPLASDGLVPLIAITGQESRMYQINNLTIPTLVVDNPCAAKQRGACAPLDNLDSGFSSTNKTFDVMVAREILETWCLLE
jgi:hypothetical protein